MANHSTILAWEISWTEATVHGVAKELDTTQQLNNNLYKPSKMQPTNEKNGKNIKLLL